MNHETFYTHYQDKNNVIIKCQEDFMNGMAGIMQGRLPNMVAYLDKNPPTTTPFILAANTIGSLQLTSPTPVNFV